MNKLGVNGPPYKLYHVRSINHNIPAGAGFGDCQLLAGIVGKPAPTKIAVDRPDMILIPYVRLLQSLLASAS